MFWKKEESKLEKIKMKIFNFLCKKDRLQILATKTSILSDHENAVFILICRVFPPIYERV